MKHFVFVLYFVEICYCITIVKDKFNFFVFVPSTPWTWIRIQMKIDSDLEPDPYYYVCSVLLCMQIQNNDEKIRIQLYTLLTRIRILTRVKSV